jgi:serine/threonine protein kinase
MVWTSGQQLQGGKYIIEQVLGQGGFGITYKAHHTMLDASVVIKTPNESLKNDPEYAKFVKRFREEGQRLEKLSENQHPNIVRVRDLFHEDGTYCLVMDFVQGDSLFNLIQKRGTLPTEKAVKYILQIGEALKVVHQAGLVHRDAHPGNIMVQQDGKAVLIDFGIAGETVPKNLSHLGIFRLRLMNKWEEDENQVLMYMPWLLPYTIQLQVSYQPNLSIASFTI